VQLLANAILSTTHWILVVKFCQVPSPSSAFPDTAGLCGAYVV